MKTLSTRFPYALAAICLYMVIFPGVMHAQGNRKDQFGGLYFGFSMGSVADDHNVGPFTANITQTTGITITSLGVVTVPGITRDIPATRTGGPALDTTFPTCTITGSPSTITCTGNSDLGTFHTIDSAMITNKGERRHAFSAGLQIGYDHQFHKVVLGGEFEYDPVSA